MTRRIVVNIGRVEVHGRAPSDAAAFRRGVERELARQLAAAGPGAFYGVSQRSVGIDLPTAEPAPLGRAIAGLVTRRPR